MNYLQNDVTTLIISYSVGNINAMEYVKNNYSSNIPKNVSNETTTRLCCCNELPCLTYDIAAATYKITHCL